MRLPIKPKTGQEPFHASDRALGFTVSDFWRWSVSDLVSNATRGRLAEFIVAKALAIPSSGVRDEWSAYDLETSGGVKVEVKSAAYIQSWYQSQLSTISFRTPKTREWNPEDNQQESEVKRQADVYVFAVLAHQDKVTIDPLNVDQWDFYVLPTATLDTRERSQYGIALSTVQKLTEKVAYAGLRSAARHAAAANARTKKTTTL